MIPATEPVAAVTDAADEDLLTRKEASAFLIQFGIRMKPETLARLWSTGGNGPPCLHVRHRPHYPRGVLRAWALDQVSDLRASAPPAARGRRHG